MRSIKIQRMLILLLGKEIGDASDEEQEVPEDAEDSSAFCGNSVDDGNDDDDDMAMMTTKIISISVMSSVLSDLVKRESGSHFIINFIRYVVFQETLYKNTVLISSTANAFICYNKKCSAYFIYVPFQTGESQFSWTPIFGKAKLLLLSHSSSKRPSPSPFR